MRMRGIAIKKAGGRTLRITMVLEQGHEEASRSTSQCERRDPDPHY